MASAGDYFRFVKFEHTIFALPFAFLAAVLAQHGVPGMDKILWITLAMAAGRTYGMGLNRILDRKIDSENPRTQSRELPAGKISLAQAWALTFASGLALVLASGMINRLCLLLSPLALFVLAFYSLTKRFTWASHLFLGLCYFLIPVAAWISIHPQWSGEAALLGLASGFWVAGFDTLYSIQDMEFDRSRGLHSLPARFGIKTALFVAKTFHGLTLALLALVGYRLGLGAIFWAGLALVSGLIVVEHQLVTPKDLSRINQAFFTVNGWVSVSLFVFTLADVLFKR